MRGVLFCLITLGWSTAAAETPDTRLTLASLEASYFEGDYGRVVASPERPASADLMALKARALLADLVSQPDDPDPADVRRAAAFARAAVNLEPRHPEGRLQLAIALSLEARGMSLGEARKSGYGPLARELAESVLADVPDNAYAMGFLSVWHIEVRRRGGPLGAAFMGASLDDAGAFYAAASRLDGQNPGLHWQYARALAALDAKKYADQIEHALNRARACGDRSQLDRVMKARAETLSDMIRSGTSYRKIEAWAAQQL